MTSGKKPGLAFWATMVVVGLPVLYVLSMGPACWISSRKWFGATAVSAVYHPLTTAFFELPYLPSSTSAICDALQWYSCVGAAPGWHWQPTSLDLDHIELVIPGRKNWIWGPY